MFHHPLGEESKGEVVTDGDETPLWFLPTSGFLLLHPIGCTFVATMFIESDFRNLSFDITKAKTGTLPHGLPELSALPSFWNCDLPKTDAVIRYIILMYDVNSPLQKRIPSLDKRKEEAANLAGINLADPQFIVLRDFKDDHFTTMVIDFLIYQNNYEWTMLVSNAQTFYEFQKTLLQESTMIRNDKDKISAIASKAKLMEESNAIVSRIREYYKYIFIEKDLEAKGAERVEAMSPELMAKSL
jgi:hypothetical protein